MLRTSLPVARLLLVATLLSGCGLHRIPDNYMPPVVIPSDEPQTPVDAAPVRPTPASPRTQTPGAYGAASTRAPDTEVQDEAAAGLQAARQSYARAHSQIGDWEAAPALAQTLASAEQALKRGDVGTARALADEVATRSEDALEVHDLLAARVELQKLQTYTGLSDAQLTRMRAGELALARRQGHEALRMLSALTREVAKASKRYVVAAGDSLWIISGRQDVYDNPLLWPLIWQANLDVIDDPNRLRAGQRLKIRINPTIDEVVKAVETARNYRSASVRIGQIREAGAAE